MTITDLSRPILPDAGSPLLSLRRVSKHYVMGDSTLFALKEIDLTIQPGEFVAIMGPSGSGKSTCMNILGCLDRPSMGDYTLAGHLVSDLATDDLARIRNQYIGFVFQQFNLLPRTTAQENVALPLLYQREPSVDHASRMQRAKTKLELVGLGARLDHHPAQLSGGQQQRVAIARALVNQPALILADEPTGALDSQTSEEVMQLLQALNQQGITIVLVTHELDIAHYARRIITFRDGQIVSDDAHTPNQDHAVSGGQS
ncbi:ABC transporter ATP-binding protein [Parvibium lacunae]|uniref:ABC transporter ATP-binding protein n=1 Tax=Parvibium lacunae TaxID=1888893 RepID=A0A368L1S1_9BURK|nr:ABC transporter ATP-binding protein [Parvibium lacunae]RCS57391.1 ABC transporter ATP-binding protein [Parvibium lacunae]